MEHVRLGSTGLPVSRLCLGTMTFGVQCDERTSFAILDRAAEGGITFLDTADVYPIGGDLSTVGRTEQIVGKWLSGRRDAVVLATKCFMPMGPRPFQAGMSRKHILDAIDASLRRLGTDVVDLYQLHADDRTVPLDETLRALDDVVRAGKARYVGVSNWAAWRVAWDGPRRWAWHEWCPSSPATTWCSGPSSATSCPCARPKAWGSSRTTLWLAACSRASTGQEAHRVTAASPSGQSVPPTGTGTGTTRSSPRSSRCGPWQPTPASPWLTLQSAGSSPNRP